jgi:hypothetical protein
MTRMAQRKQWIAVAGLVVVAALAAAALRSGLLRTRPAQEASIQRKQDRIFKEIDQTALRDACRTMIVKFGDGYLKRLELKDPRIPPIVLRLEPTEVFLVQNYLRIELGDAHFHYGLEAFRDRLTQAPFPISRELMDGLWYYEDASEEMVKRFAK